MCFVCLWVFEYVCECYAGGVSKVIVVINYMLSVFHLCSSAFKKTPTCAQCDILKKKKNLTLSDNVLYVHCSYNIYNFIVKRKHGPCQF